MNVSALPMKGKYGASRCYVKGRGVFGAIPDIKTWVFNCGKIYPTAI